MARLINQEIKAASDKSNSHCGSEKEANRHVHYSDLNQYGVKDALVLYTVEGVGCGNNYWSSLAVFYKSGKDYKLADAKKIGGKWGPHVEPDSLGYRNGLIHLVVLEHAEKDASCCPSIKRKAFYLIQNGKLTETSSPQPTKK